MGSKFNIQYDLDKLISELVFKTSRSSGPGGQHVNKVNTKIELRFNITESKILSETDKSILLSKLKNKINNEGELIIISQEDRSQLKNKENAIVRFLELLEEVFKPDKKRVPTKPSKSKKEKRLKTKRIHSLKKQSRKPPEKEKE